MFICKLALKNCQWFWAMRYKNTKMMLILQVKICSVSIVLLDSFHLNSWNYSMAITYKTYKVPRTPGRNILCFQHLVHTLLLLVQGPFGRLPGDIVEDISSSYGSNTGEYVSSRRNLEDFSVFLRLLDLFHHCLKTTVNKPRTGIITFKLKKVHLSLVLRIQEKKSLN